jgi:hypothetical protein
LTALAAVGSRTAVAIAALDAGVVDLRLVLLGLERLGRGRDPIVCAHDPARVSAVGARRRSRLSFGAGHDERQEGQDDEQSDRAPGHVVAQMNGSRSGSPVGRPRRCRLLMADLPPRLTLPGTSAEVGNTRSVMKPSNSTRPTPGWSSSEWIPTTVWMGTLLKGIDRPEASSKVASTWMPALPSPVGGASRVV